MMKQISSIILNSRAKSVFSTMAWVIVILLPFLTRNWRGGIENWSDYLRYVISIVAFIAVSWTNKRFLVKHFLFKKRVILYLVAYFLLGIVLLYLAYRLTMFLPKPEKIKIPDLPEHISAVRYIFMGMLMCTLISAISVARMMTSSWYTAEDERRELERSRSEAELQNLKSQLNPHFLFNTLNNIYSMIAINQEKAQEAVHELSRLLRYVLYESSEQSVSVEKDFDFVRNYVELMRIRLPNHVKLDTEITTTAPDARVAPLLLITLIENAFKHGVSNNQHSFLKIHITADEKTVNCSIENSYFPKTETDKSGSGIGMSNLQKRLNLIYGGRHIFSSGLYGDVYRSSLIIQL